MVAFKCLHNHLIKQLPREKCILPLPKNIPSLGYFGNVHTFFLIFIS